MKSIYFTISMIFLSCFYLCAENISYKSTDDNLLTVIIMVKNEIDVIIPTLQPFIDVGITHYLVFDTGSTDGTQDIIREHFDHYGFEHAYIIEEPFIDFATSRNRALDLAEQIFVNTTFFLMLDAEWYMHDIERLLTYCALHKNYRAPNTSGSCYLIRLLTVQDMINNYVPRLFRRGTNVRYEGVVHESIGHTASGILPDSIYFEYNPARSGKEKTKARCKRDYQLLKKHHEENPTDTRTLFYLAQTCQFLDEWQEAIYYYYKRLELGEVSEEKYLAAYRIGCAIEHIMENYSDDSVKLKYSWYDALHFYLIAHNMLPYRAEPLFRIACYYIRNQQHAVAYLFAHRAVQVPYPQKDGLFIEKRIYDFLRYDILGQCAIYAGEHAIGKSAILRALEYAPDNSCLHHNLSIYNNCCSA